MPSWLRDVPFGTIWGLVWPQMMMLLCTIVINLTDIWTAGRISADVQAAVGVSFQVQVFLLVFGVSLGAGGMASVSQSMGAGKPWRAQNYVGLALSSCLVLSACIAGLIWLLRGQVLAVLQTPDELLPATNYMLRVMLCGLPFACVTQVAGTLFRAARQVIAPLLIMLASCLLNVAGDLCFGLGWLGAPALGMPGIAWSTFAANVISAVLSVAFLKRGGLIGSRFVPPLRWLKIGAPYLFKVALPSCGNSMLWHAGYLVMFGITAALPDGVSALAGLTAGNRIESLLYMPANAFMVTASILVGNALGAGDRALARRTGLALFFISGISMSAVAACLWPFIPDLAGFFSSESPVQTQIVNYLFFNVLVVPFTVSGLVLHGVMNGAGATVYSLIVNTACIWLVRLPLGWSLAHFVFHDAYGVYMAMFVSMVIQTSAMVWVYFRKDWARFALGAHAHHIHKEKA
ncbi:MAG: MATE family efflux transporter [Mailhella sp.]|nr:MATE family efflux transporter [Mailhella sp.]